MAGFQIRPPSWGEPITVENGRLVIPDKPIILYIEGDGIGPEVVTSMRRVLDAAVAKAYGGRRKIAWTEVLAGERAGEVYGKVLPEETLDAIRRYYIGIKGPLTTPVGGGYRSLNVAIRKALDLYANVRPSRYFTGVPSPIKHPERVNMVVFRENTEDVYAGIEWPYNSPEADKIRAFLKQEFGIQLREDAGIGLKPISEFGTKRLVRKAIRYAIERKRPSVTLVHKGNIMKYTEGAFRDWGYEVAREEFGDYTITEQELWEKYNGQVPEGKVVIKDRIADNMLQQILTRTAEYSVLATPNLNGDYISDAISGLVGGLGLAPGGNIGDVHAVFEPVHGTAPKYAGKNVINPTAEILSGALMLEHMGWFEAADLIYQAVEKTISARQVTQDLARHMEGVKPLSTTEYTDALIANL